MKQNISIAVDVLVFTLIDKKLFALLIKRKNEPFANQLAFPGGFIKDDELLKNAALRELQEETGLQNIKNIEILNIYDDPKRDPRGRIISLAFISVINSSESTNVKAGDDAQEILWVPVEEIKDLAFDHNKMLADAMRMFTSI